MKKKIFNLKIDNEFKKLIPPLTIKELSQLMTIMDVLSMDKDIVLQALGSGFKDFEDALQNFSAIKSGFIDVILTRNVKDYSKSDTGVLTPGSYLKTFTANLQ